LNHHRNPYFLPLEAPMCKIPALFVVFSALTLSAALAAHPSSHEGGGTSQACAVTPAMLAQGKAVYEKNCVTCHATGVAGAPKFGDKAAWKEHIAAGLEHMAEIVIHGVGAMPPRGGNPNLSDAEIHAAVAYIAENSR
jgi:cytochrome c5